MKKRKLLAALLGISMLFSSGSAVFAEKDFADDDLASGQAAEITADADGGIYLGNTDSTNDVNTIGDGDIADNPEEIIPKSVSASGAEEESTEGPIVVEYDEPKEDASEKNTDETAVLAEDELTEYSIAKDETYVFENVGVVSQDITGINGKYDYVIYYKDGSIKEYYRDYSSSNLTVPAGGKLKITAVNDGLKLKLADDYFLTEQAESPVMKNTELNPGDTYVYTNTGKVNCKLLLWENSYDYVLYDVEGNISDYGYTSGNKEIPAGYSIKITQRDNTNKISGLYDMFDMKSESVPVAKKMSVRPGETYTYTNKGNKAYKIFLWYNDYDYVLYDVEGNINDYGYTNGDKEIPAGCSIKITPREGSNEIYGLYDIFEVKHEETPVAKKTTVSVGETYTYTNKGNKTYKIFLWYNDYDYVLYDVDGNISDYGYTNGDKEIPAGCSIKITPREGSNEIYGLYDIFEVKHEETPVAKKTYIDERGTCTYTNKGNKAYTIFLWYNDYDYVLYDGEGNISDYGCTRGNKEIPAGCSIKITARRGSNEIYGLYDIFDISNDGSPVMKNVILNNGESCTFENYSNAAYKVFSDNSYGNYVIYYSNGKVKETKENTSINNVEVPAGGRIEFTQNDTYIATIYALWEVFGDDEVSSRYKISNDNSVSAEVKLYSELYYDYAIYDSDSKLTEYEIGTRSNISIPQGGYALIDTRYFVIDANPNTGNLFSSDSQLRVTTYSGEIYAKSNINKGETYIYTNKGSRELNVYKDGAYCDYVIYNADGSISDYASNSSSDKFTVPIGGKLAVTARGYIVLRGLSEYFDAEKVNKAVFDTSRVNVGKTYQYTNNAAKGYKLYFRGGAKDYAIYDAAGELKEVSLNNDYDEIEVPSGSRIVVTSKVTDMEVSSLNEAFTYSSRNYPIFKQTNIGCKEKGVMNNLSDTNQKVYTSTENYINYVTYDSGNNIQEAKELAQISEMVVPANGRVEITPIISDISVSGLYECFSDEDLTVHVTGITLSSGDISLEKGKQTILRANILPENATNKNVKWSSSNPSVAVAAQTGKVTAKAAGTAVITAATEDGGYTASCTVTVTSSGEPNPPAADYPYTINSLTLKSETGESYSSVPSGKSFIADVNITETKARNEEDIVFIAVYDKNGALLSLNYAKSDFVENRAYSIGFNIPAQSRAVGTVKAYIWHSFTNTEPLAETMVLN